MLGQCSMACLTVHMRMLAFALHIKHVGVACLTGLMTCKRHRAGCNLSDCIAAIVPVLTEALRNHVTSNHEKDDEGQNEQPCESK